MMVAKIKTRQHLWEWWFIWNDKCVYFFWSWLRIWFCFYNNNWNAHLSAALAHNFSWLKIAKITDEIGSANEFLEFKFSAPQPLVGAHVPSKKLCLTTSNESKQTENRHYKKHSFAKPFWTKTKYSEKIMDRFDYVVWQDREVKFDIFNV